MTLLIAYRIIEHYGDADPPEPFGYEFLHGTPSVGDLVTLHWLDGREAHRVRVESISGTTLHVRVAS
jgi:hypothetical protein